jgi:hypothetical protein
VVFGGELSPAVALSSTSCLLLLATNCDEWRILRHTYPKSMPNVEVYFSASADDDLSALTRGNCSTRSAIRNKDANTNIWEPKYSPYELERHLHPWRDQLHLVNVYFERNHRS